MTQLPIMAALFVLAALPGVTALVLGQRRGRRDRERAESLRHTLKVQQEKLARVAERLVPMEHDVKALRSSMAGFQDDLRARIETGQQSPPSEPVAAAHSASTSPSAGAFSDPVPRQGGSGDGLDGYGNPVDLPSGGVIGRPVDVESGQVVLSRSLQSVGLLEGGDGRTARLYLNEGAEIDHLAFDRWKEFFDFGGGGPYRRYRTLRPAEIEWNETTGRGRLAQTGSARQL
jgi:hypothetical protein